MIVLDAVGKRYGDAPALDRVSLRIAPGEFTVLIGASGSGKSTLLRLINRLVEADSGRILLQGQDIRSLRPELLRRRIGYAIQSTGLFPHWTVARNIGTVPALLGWPAARIADRVDALLDLLGLAPAQFRQRYPHQLSGGQAQRVGVARALAADPDLLLLDEPFGALDPPNRAALQDALARIHRASGKTIVMVTHDIDEALRLAGRIVLLDCGRIVQAGTPAQLLDQPASPVVSTFLGAAAAGLQRLGLQTVAGRTRRGETAAGAPLAAGLSLRDALSVFLASGADRLPVVDASGAALGALHFADLLHRPDPAPDLTPDPAPAAAPAPAADAGR